METGLEPGGKLPLFFTRFEVSFLNTQHDKQPVNHSKPVKHGTGIHVTALTTIPAWQQITPTVIVKQKTCIFTQTSLATNYQAIVLWV